MLCFEYNSVPTYLCSWHEPSCSFPDGTQHSFLFRCTLVDALLVLNLLGFAYCNHDAAPHIAFTARFIWRTGGLAFSVRGENLEAVLYRHDKYDCGALDTAAKAYIAWAEQQEAVEVAINVFKASACFGLTKSYDSCGRNLAQVLPMLER